MYILNDDKEFKYADIYIHPDTNVFENVSGDEMFRRSVEENLHRKDNLYTTIVFLEGKLKEIDEDIYFPDSLGNQCSRAFYTRNLKGLKKFRKHLYNCEGACYERAEKIIGEILDFSL